MIGESNVAIDPAIGGYGVADIYLGEFSPHTLGVVGSGLAQRPLAGKVNLLYGSERPHPPATGLLASQDSESTRRIGPGLSISG